MKFRRIKGRNNFICKDVKTTISKIIGTMIISKQMTTIKLIENQTRPELQSKIVQMFTKIIIISTIPNYLN